MLRLRAKQELERKGSEKMKSWLKAIPMIEMRHMILSPTLNITVGMSELERYPFDLEICAPVDIFANSL